MRKLTCLALVIAAASLTSPANADYGKPPPPPSSTGSSGEPPPQSGEMTARQRAEAYYRDAYDDVVKATADWDAGKQDNAKKKFKRALDRSQRAVAEDSSYTEAWNLVGFTSRKLGDYDAAFAAYQIALRQNPRFALAREYYGQGLLEKGDLVGAKVQLSWLRRIGDEKLTAQLATAIDKFVAEHPVATPAAAAPDSAAATH